MTLETSALDILTVVGAAAAVVMLRNAAGSDGATLVDLFRTSIDPPWPRGIQEEEPVRWRTELFDRSPTKTSTMSVASASGKTQCHPGAGTRWAVPDPAPGGMGGGLRGR